MICSCAYRRRIVSASIQNLLEANGIFRATGPGFLGDLIAKMEEIRTLKEDTQTSQDTNRSSLFDGDGGAACDDEVF